MVRQDQTDGPSREIHLVKPWISGLSSILHCQKNGPSVQGSVGMMGRRNNGPSEQRAVGVVGRRSNGTHPTYQELTPPGMVCIH